MSKSILTRDLNAFVDDLIDRLPVYGPVESREDAFSKYRFKKLKSGKELKIGYGPTVIPPKKYLFPARAELFTFKGTEVFPPKNKEFLLLGINKRDGEGLFYFDKAMTLPIADLDYTERRKFMKVVIIDNQPPSNAIDCDLYLHRVDKDHLLAFSYTPFGEELLSLKYFALCNDTGKIIGRNLQDELIFHPRLAEIVEASKDHPIWQELADKCLHCGICSYSCPLCYCFEVEDSLKITNDIHKDQAGKREKRWDSCMLPDFAKISFENFRDDYKDRIYNWYFHKFVRMPKELGFPGCVDCGRCIHYCPVGINYRNVLTKLVEDEKRSKLHTK